MKILTLSYWVFVDGSATPMVTLPCVGGGITQSKQAFYFVITFAGQAFYFVITFAGFFLWITLPNNLNRDVFLSRRKWETPTFSYQSTGTTGTTGTHRRYNWWFVMTIRRSFISRQKDRFEEAHVIVIDVATILNFRLYNYTLSTLHCCFQDPISHQKESSQCKQCKVR